MHSSWLAADMFTRGNILGKSFLLTTSFWATGNKADNLLSSLYEL